MSRRSGSPSPCNADESVSRKKSRYLSRSDEEIREEMDARRVSYRTGWPTLPPMPLDTIFRDAKNSIKDADERLQEVLDILAAQDIRHSQVSFAFRVPKDMDDSEDREAHLTLLFTADILESTDKIKDAVVKIRGNFRNHESTESVRIEAVDRRAMVCPPTYPIRGTESELVDQWDKLTPDLLSALRGRQWVSLELVRRGIDERDRCPPTIVLGSPLAGDVSWSNATISSIQAVLKKYPIAFEVEILLAGSILCATKNRTPSTHVDSSSSNNDISIESSMGTSNDEDSSGTGHH